MERAPAGLRADQISRREHPLRLIRLRTRPDADRKARSRLLRQARRARAWRRTGCWLRLGMAGTRPCGQEIVEDVSRTAVPALSV
jgi:hypothetical protein